MRTHALVTLVVGLVLSAVALAGDAPTEELKKLAGTWKMVAFDVAGKASPDQDVKRMRLVIKGSQLTLAEQDKPATTMGMQVDPTQTPKALDLLINRGDERIGWKCIYALDGDRLKLCIPLAPKK